VADPNLSLIAWRSAKIINSLAGREVYNIDHESAAFDWSSRQQAENTLERLEDILSTQRNY
jgi:lysine N6-hydroxylase